MTTRSSIFAFILMLKKNVENLKNGYFIEFLTSLLSRYLYMVWY